LLRRKDRKGDEKQVKFIVTEKALWLILLIIIALLILAK